MSSWVLPSGGNRRPQPNPNGGAQPLRSFRRPAPYPPREERTEDNNADGELSYEQLDQQHYSGQMNYEGYQHQQTAAPEAYTSPPDQHKTLYQRLYRQIQEERRAADCVVLSVSNQSTDYPKSLGQCLQERGLSVEMLYLQAESGLTQALQDVRGLGSPLCILVEQTNVALCSCTVIIFSESLKIHRNMPKEQAMDFVMAEYRRGLGEHCQKDPAELMERASELVEDYLERGKLERHAVPPETRQLLLFLAEGLHLYPDELGTLSDYLRSRQDHVQASSSEADRVRPERKKILPSGLGKPPPLLPTPSPSGPHIPQPAMGEPPQPTPLMAPPGSYPKTKPPPLLSMHRSPHGPPPRGPHGPPGPRGPPHHLLGPPSPRGPLPPRGPVLQGGPLLQGGPPHSLMGPRGPMPPRGPRGAPPSLKSLHMGGPQPGLLPCPGGPPPRPPSPWH